MLSNDHGYVYMCIDFCYTHCVDQGQGQRQCQLQGHLKSKGQGHQRSKVKVTGEMNYNMQYFRSMKHYTCKSQGQGHLQGHLHEKLTTHIFELSLWYLIRDVFMTRVKSYRFYMRTPAQNENNSICRMTISMHFAFSKLSYPLYLYRTLADFHFYAFYHYRIYEKNSCDEKLDWQQSSGCSLIAYKQGDAYGSENYSCKDRNRLTTSLYIPIFTTEN